MNILEELWLGKIDPSGKPLQSGSPYARAMHSSADAETKLRAVLTTEQKELLNMISSAEIEMLSIAQTEAFSYGFRLGTQLLLSALERK